MRDLQQLRSLRWVGVGVGRASHRRALDGETGAPEDEQVEVEFARSPAPSHPASEVALHVFEGDEERQSARLWRSTGGNVQGDDGIAELRLVDDAHRVRRIEPGNGTEACPRQRGKSTHRLGQRRLRVTDVRPETDVCADSSFGHAVSIDQQPGGVADSRPHEPR